MTKSQYYAQQNSQQTYCVEKEVKFPLFRFAVFFFFEKISPQSRKICSITTCAGSGQEICLLSWD